MVVVGLTVVEPLADVEVNVPGVIAIVVAPLVVQLNVLLSPEGIAAGLAINVATVGAVPPPPPPLALTTNVTVVVCCVEPDVPVIVTVYVPAAVPLVVVTVNVDVPDVLMLVGEKDGVPPPGSPEAASVTVPAKPDSAPTVAV